MRFRLRQLEALIAVADHGTMTRAAEELGISQPAVSRLLVDLSREMGFTLFERRGGRLVPTQECRFLLPDLRKLIERMDHIGEVSRAILDRRAGHLKIACLPGFATSHLPKVLADFLKTRAGVTATLEPDRPERIMEWIIGEQYDCAITDGFEPHPAVHSETVDIRTVCIFPEGHPLQAREVVRPADLRGQPLILARRDSAFQRDFAEHLSRAGVEAEPRIETRQFTAACELVALGAGVAVISELDARGYAGRGVLFRPFDAPLFHRLALVRPIHKSPSMITLEFLDRFRDSLRPFEAA